jgi:transcriptional regulator with XRE-family HTH domain
VKQRIDGHRVRELREKLGWTKEKLAAKSGASIRSVADVEAGRRQPRQETIDCVAAALDVTVEDLFERAPTHEPRASLVPPTKLRALVDAERAEPPRPEVATDDGAVPSLGAALFHAIATAFATYEGSRFAVAGRVDTHHPISRGEARILGTRLGVGARFHVEVPVAPGRALGVTVHTRDATQTRELLAREGADVTLVVRVVVAPEEEEEGFFFFMAKKSKPWALVVERVG